MKKSCFHIVKVSGFLCLVMSKEENRSRTRSRRCWSSINSCRNKSAQTVPIPLEQRPSDEIRKLCVAEGVRGTRDGKKRKTKKELVVLLKEHIENSSQTAAAIDVISSSSSSSSSSSNINSSSNNNHNSSNITNNIPLPVDSKQALHIRLLNVLFSDALRDDFIHSGDKPSKVAFDTKATGAASPFWGRVAAAFNSLTPQADIDKFVPCTDGGPHSFLSKLDIRLGPLWKRDYTSEDVFGMWHALKRTYKAKAANFNQSGNHDQGEEAFTGFIHRTDAGYFYLFQWISVFPELEDFVTGTISDGGGKIRDSLMCVCIFIQIV
eukprot:GHVU01186920.1.p1 GENE.GHVU01186920.1~~GHVU01186920.1.p1  ORF type:complete len:322 (+),score=57.15 GHVU01186920.1:327-1292(+)